MSLNEYIFKIDKPCVFRNILKSDNQKSNSCIEWTPEILKEIFGEEKFTFRIGKRHLENSETQFENQCEYIDAEIGQFIEWIKPRDLETNKKAKLDERSPFDDYNIEEYWAYADYKYMIEFFKSDDKDSRINSRCIDWRSFGFENRDANQSTLWIGSQGAYTPCHFDTYGYNLVAQIYGKKRWIMFAKTDSPLMYPTRVPFEESTVYSKVNIRSPDLNKYPLFKNVKPYVIDLEPGDVLYVPTNWWHYVENIETSISINSWIELEAEDNYSRLKEIISKMVLQGLMESNMVHFDNWLNSSENYASQDENMELMSKCLEAIKSNHKTEQETSKKDYENLAKEHTCFSRFIDPIPFENFLDGFTIKSNNSKPRSTTESCLLVDLSNAATQPNVVDLIAKNLLENLGIN